MLMHREKMIKYLNDAKNIKLSKLYFAHADAWPEARAHLHPNARIIQPLSDEKRIDFSGGRGVGLKPGEAIVCHPGTWVWEHWDVHHEMISVVFPYQYVRTIYIQADGTMESVNRSKVFFHTSEPLNRAGRSMIDAMLAIDRDTEAARLCYAALLETVLEALTNDDRHGGRQEAEWRSVVEAMQIYYLHDISIDDVAESVNMHPVTLSRLIRKVTGKNFRAWLNEMRMQYALEILRQPASTVGSTAAACGFNYANYFIRIFRQTYGVSPEVWKQRQNR